MMPALAGLEDNMNQTDLLGNPFTGATEEALEHYAKALEQFHCYRGDPVATVETATASAPEFAMGHLLHLHAWLYALSTEPEATAVVLADLERTSELPLNRRERGHAEAITAFTGGRWRDAGRILEGISMEYPRDALALQAGHVGDEGRAARWIAAQTGQDPRETVPSLNLPHAESRNRAPGVGLHAPSP
jgi:hypothetical protein